MTTDNQKTNFPDYAPFNRPRLTRQSHCQRTFTETPTNKTYRSFVLVAPEAFCDFRISYNQQLDNFIPHRKVTGRSNHNPHCQWVFYSTYCLLPLHFPPRIYWHFISPRLQAVIHHYPHHSFAPSHTFNRSLLIFLLAEVTVQCMTFGFHLNPGLNRLLSSSVLSFIRFSHICKCFVCYTWFSGFVCARLPSANIVWTY